MLSPKYESYHEDVKYLQKALMPLGFDISSLKECPIRLVTEIRFYLMFMREHKYPNRKEFRKLLKSRQTFKTISVNSSFSQSNGDETTLTCFLFMYFWSQHHCENPDCNKFSYMKCGECKQAYYCSKTCQELKQRNPSFQQYLFKFHRPTNERSGNVILLISIRKNTGNIINRIVRMTSPMVK